LHEEFVLRVAPANTFVIEVELRVTEAHALVPVVGDPLPVALLDELGQIPAESILGALDSGGNLESERRCVAAAVRGPLVWEGLLSARRMID
jgi:hypothetical protein